MLTVGNLASIGRKIWGYHPLSQFVLWTVLIALMASLVLGFQSCEQAISQHFSPKEDVDSEQPLFAQIVIDDSGNITGQAATRREQALGQVLRSLSLLGESRDSVNFLYFGSSVSGKANDLYTKWRIAADSNSSITIDSLVSSLCEDLNTYSALEAKTDFPYLFKVLNQRQDRKGLEGYNFTTFIISDFLSDTKNELTPTEKDNLEKQFRNFTTLIDYGAASRESNHRDGKFINEVVLIDIQQQTAENSNGSTIYDLSQRLDDSGFLEYIGYDDSRVNSPINRVIERLRHRRVFSITAEPYRQHEKPTAIQLKVYSSSEALQLNCKFGEPIDSTVVFDLDGARFGKDIPLPLNGKSLDHDLTMGFWTSAIGVDDKSPSPRTLTIHVLRDSYEDRLQFEVLNKQYPFKIIPGDSLKLLIKFYSRYNEKIKVCPRITSTHSFEIGQVSESLWVDQKMNTGTNYAIQEVWVVLSDEAIPQKAKQLLDFNIGFDYALHNDSLRFHRALRNDLNFSWPTSEEALQQDHINVTMVSRMQSLFYHFLLALGLTGSNFMNSIGFLLFVIVIFPHLYHLWHSHHLLTKRTKTHRYRTFWLRDLVQVSIRDTNGWSGLQVLGLLVVWVVLCVICLALYTNYGLLTHSQEYHLTSINLHLLAISLGICLVNAAIVTIGLSIRFLLKKAELDDEDVGENRANVPIEQISRTEGASTKEKAPNLLDQYSGLIRWLDRRLALEFIFTLVIYVTDITQIF